MLIPALFVSYYFNGSDKGGLVISLGWLIGAFLVGSVVRSVGVVLANTSELVAHSIRLAVDEQSSAAAGEALILRRSDLRCDDCGRGLNRFQRCARPRSGAVVARLVWPASSGEEDLSHEVH